MPQRLYVQCPECDRIYYAISAERLRRINPLGDDDSRYRQCQCGAPASTLTQVSADALPPDATIKPLLGAPVDMQALAAFEAAEDEDEGLDEQGFPILPPAPKDVTEIAAGKHWGMKYAIGWSNPVNCPDSAILGHALALADRSAIEEGIRHYGLDRVQAFWRRLKEVVEIKEKPTRYSRNNGDLFQRGVRRTDQILAEFETNNGS